MPIWIEIRCSGFEDPECYSMDNDDPGILSHENNASVSSSIRILSKQAITGGWKKTREGWLCPVCAKPKKKGATND